MRWVPRGSLCFTDECIMQCCFLWKGTHWLSNIEAQHTTCPMRTEPWDICSDVSQVGKSLLLVWKISVFLKWSSKKISTESIWIKFPTSHDCSLVVPSVTARTHTHTHTHTLCTILLWPVPLTHQWAHSNCHEQTSPSRFQPWIKPSRKQSVNILWQCIISFPCGIVEFAAKIVALSICLHRYRHPANFRALRPFATLTFLTTKPGSLGYKHSVSNSHLSALWQKVQAVNGPGRVGGAGAPAENSEQNEQTVTHGLRGPGAAGKRQQGPVCRHDNKPQLSPIISTQQIETLKVLAETQRSIKTSLHFMTHFHQSVKAAERGLFQRIQGEPCVLPLPSKIYPPPYFCANRASLSSSHLFCFKFAPIVFATSILTSLNAGTDPNQNAQMNKTWGFAPPYLAWYPKPKSRVRPLALIRTTLQSFRFIAQWNSTSGPFEGRREGQTLNRGSVRFLSIDVKVNGSAREWEENWWFTHRNCSWILS